MKNNGPVYQKSYQFALSVIQLYKELTKQNEFLLSKQLLRSGTSIGANVNEAAAAESKKDFKHKMAIASKEARESMYWLNLLKESDLIKFKINIEQEIKDCDELIRILTSIVKTTQHSQLKTKNSYPRW